MSQRDGTQPPFDDKLEIMALAVRYGTAIDDKQEDLLRDVFTPDCHYDYGHPDRVWDDTEDVVALMKVLHVGMDLTQHRMFNHEVTIDGHRATHRCYVEACFFEAGLADGEVLKVHGRYEDELELRPEGWRISARNFVMGFAEGNWAVGGLGSQRPDE